MTEGKTTQLLAANDNVAPVWSLLTRDERYWHMVKNTVFDLRPKLVYMNFSNVAVVPLPVRSAEAKYGIVEQDPSPTNRQLLGERREITRRKAAEYIGADDADDIALVPNGTAGNNIVVNGYPLGPNEEVLGWDANHETNREAWLIRAKREGFRVRLVSLPRKLEDPEEIEDTFRQAISPETRLIAISAVSNTTGVRLPVKRICGMARERGIHTLIDGAQMLGALKTKVPELGCDILTSSGHKYGLGPHGTGVLYMRRELSAKIRPNSVGFDGHIKFQPDLQTARKFEALGQMKDAPVAALAAAFDLHTVIGPAAVEERVLFLASMLRVRLREIGVMLMEPANPVLHAGIVIIDVPPQKRAAFADALDRKGIVGSPTNGYRLSPHISNTLDDVSQVIEVVSECRALLEAA